MNRTLCLTLLFSLAAAALPDAALAWSFSATTGNDIIIVGYAGGRVRACVNDVPTNLRSDTSAANALNRDVSIYGLAGGDSFFYVRTAGYNPGTAYDCGYSSWSPISSFAGWLLSFEGDAGSDIMEGADGSKPMWMYANGTSGGDYFNYLFGFSSAITMLGYVSPDDMISDTTGGAEILRGFDGGDCLHDFSNTFGEFNCGAGSDVRHFSNTGTANCENTTSCCGLC